MKMLGFDLPMEWPWVMPPEPPPPEDFGGKLIVLASEGRSIPQAAISLAARMAEKGGADVHVVSIARIWGTSFGFPHPGLLPNKREMEERQESVASTIRLLKRRKIGATAQIFGTRNAAKRIITEARRRSADAIVMAADPPRHWLISDMLWSQEPYRVRRLARIPVYLVLEDQKPGDARRIGPSQ
jgi:nucleotide-binding universal stress UspA family protein